MVALSASPCYPFWKKGRIFKGEEMKIEKRRDPRTLIKIKIDYKSKGAYLYSYSKDLSEGGIFIQTKSPLKVGERIKLKFILPELLEKIETWGEVAWVNEAGTEGLTEGMGVRFVDLDDRKAKLIEDVIRKIEEGKKATPIE